MATESDIAAWIGRQLERREWSAADLARRTGIGSGRISEWMTGKRRPSPASCLRLADVFVVDPDDVLALAGHREASSPLPADEPRTRIANLVRRVNLTPDRAAGLEATLLAWIEFDRASTETQPRNGG
jgi:transcriptional regulator with XRE-family HTH domain